VGTGWNTIHLPQFKKARATPAALHLPEGSSGALLGRAVLAKQAIRERNMSSGKLLVMSARVAFGGHTGRGSWREDKWVAMVTGRER